MALIAYDNVDAAVFSETRHLGDDALENWRAAIVRHLDPRPGMRVLDLVVAFLRGDAASVGAHSAAADHRRGVRGGCRPAARGGRERERPGGRCSLIDQSGVMDV